jgi:hypothetical protein
VGSYIDRWVRQLVRRGVRSGLIEGSNVWLSIGALAWLFRLLYRRQPAEVSVERLRLGESVVVSHVPAPPRTKRAKRKAAAKAAKLEQVQLKRQAKREASRHYARATAKAARSQAGREAAMEQKRARKCKCRRLGRGQEPVGRGGSEGDAEDSE